MPRGGIIVSEISKYLVSFFFDDKGLTLSLLNVYLFFYKFSKVKDPYEVRNIEFLSFHLI